MSNVTSFGQLTKTRTKRAKRNIQSSLIGQCITLICGIIVPQLLIKVYGSEAYGATVSIAQFLSYIVLLEGGIGGVARAALYKPLAKHNFVDVTKILNEIKFLFKMIGYAFAVYVFILAFSFKSMAHIQYFDWFSTVLLVIVISLSTFAQYFIGISNMVLLQADQKTYITNVVNMGTLALNTLLIVVLVHMNFGLIFVKFISALVFAMRPCFFYWYVHTSYPLITTEESDTTALQQKWSGLGQHFAFFLHSNTDVVILTLFSNLKVVAVYSVYNMITSHVQSLITSFVSGMEALFGDMLARKEIKNLNKLFNYYETILSLVALPLCAVTMLLIVPFVKLYTQSVIDINYLQPTFAVLLVCTILIYCLRTPYHSLTIAAGHFKQTQCAAYGEALINVTLSIVLVNYLGLIGVAIGTLVAVVFRFIYYVFYLARNLAYRSFSLFLKRMTVNLFIFTSIYLVGTKIICWFKIYNYFHWTLVGILVSLVAFATSIGIIKLTYPAHLRFFIQQIKKIST